MTPKLLVCIPSPRDIPEFLEAIDKVNHEKCWIKYVGYENNPYKIFRKIFLDNKEFTHLAICPDDLIITAEGIEQLWQDAQTGLPIVMGTCNVDTSDYDMLAMTWNLPSIIRNQRSFYFMRKEDLHYKTDNEGPIIQVAWCGTPFAILSRELVEQIEFVGDKEFNEPADRTESFDIQICTFCKNLGVKIMVDTRVFFRHVRHGGEIKVGTHFPRIIFKGKSKKLYFKEPKVKSVFDHPLYQIIDPLQFPDEFKKLGLPAERPPKNKT